MKKILVLTSGNISKIEAFEGAEKASFDDINFSSESRKVLVGNKDLKNFDTIYFRLVGRSLEIASLVSDYAKKNNIKVVDRVYTDSGVFPITQSKAMEMKKLSDAGVAIPKTFFGSLVAIQNNSSFKPPFVIKSTSGRRGREVYCPKNQKELKELVAKLQKEEKEGKRFFAQEFIPSEDRVRLLVVGGNVIGAIRQYTKWRKRLGSYKPEEDGAKISEFIFNAKLENLALSAVSAAGLDVCGVDVLFDQKTKKAYVIEANAAPSWNLINKYCGVSVESEILKFLQTI